MADPLELRFTVTPEFWQQAMDAWRPPFDPKKRTWPRRVVVPLLAAGGVSGALAASGLYDALGPGVLAGFVPGVLIGLLTMLTFWKADSRTLADLTKAQILRQGETRARLDPKGIHLENQLGNTFFLWAALDQVVAMPQGEALRFGTVLWPVPHPGDGGAALRDRLALWWRP